MTPNDLMQEILRTHQRLTQQAVVDPKKEIADNVYPLLQLMTETFGTMILDTHQRLEIAEASIAEYLTAQESMILPELAADIQLVLALAMDLADSVLALVPADGDGQDEIKKKAMVVRTRAEQLQPEIAEVTLVEVPDDEVPGDDDLTPVEIPKRRPPPPEPPPGEEGAQDESKEDDHVAS